jgi:PP-loop superfamily ATP-utilizing enzyme
MEEPVVKIHPLDYLFQGLEAAEVLKLHIVSLIKEEANRLKTLKLKLNSVRRIVEVNQINSEKLTQIFENDQNFMPLVARFITVLAELDEISACKTILEMIQVLNKITECMIQVQVQLNQKNQ